MIVPSAGLARRGLLAVVVALALAWLAACSPADGVDVQYVDYSIQPSRVTMKTGDIVFNINNQKGQVLHEFLVVKTGLPADQLPVGANSQVDESQLNIVGQVAQIDLGQSAKLATTLAPGHYVLMCNIVGHYQLGMHADFTVTP